MIRKINILLNVLTMFSFVVFGMQPNPDNNENIDNMDIEIGNDPEALEEDDDMFNIINGNNMNVNQDNDINDEVIIPPTRSGNPITKNPFFNQWNQ